MPPERRERVKELFGAALELAAPTDRAHYLAEHCEDPEIRAEVLELLAEHDLLGEFIESPPPALSTALIRTAMASMENRRIGAYRLVRKLGEGGMGAVYLAERADAEFHKQVAIKLVRPGVRSAEVVQRFLVERQILAALEHPHIARLLDGGTTPEGEPYFVMEFVDGVPIHRYCRDRKLGVPERLQLFRQVCEAVAYAHGRGVIHRDLKPGNILIAGDATPKLVDFGIAKVLHPEVLMVGVSETATGSEFRLMTPEYASPEQVRGQTLTAATDVYSLGVVLFELLTDQKPYNFPSRIAHEMARVICEDEPTPPSTLARSNAQAREDRDWRRLLSGDLDSIALMALRKEPERRYGSVAALCDDIDRHARGFPVRARRESAAYQAGKFARRNRVAMLATLAVASALTAVIWQMRVAERERTSAERTRNAAVMRLVWSGAEANALGSISPDGKILSYADVGAGGLKVWNLESDERRALATQAVYSVFSPDSKSLAYTWAGPEWDEVRVTHADGTAPRTLWRGDSRSSFRVTDWKRDTIAGVFSKGPQSTLAVLSTDGRFQVLEPDLVELGRVQLSSDARTVLHAHANRDDGTNDLYAYSMAEGRDVPVAQHPADDIPVGWLDDDRVLFASDRTGAYGLWALNLKTRAETLVRPNTGRVEPMGITSAGALYFAVYTGFTDIYEAEIERPEARQLKNRRVGANAFPAWSADGRKLVYQTRFTEEAPTLVVREGAGRDRRVRPLLSFFRRPLWVGESLVVAGNDGPQSGIFEVQPDTGKTRMLFSERQLEGQFAPTWSRDGKTLYSRFRELKRGIYRMSSAGGTKQVLWKPPAEGGVPVPSNPALSPDGKMLAFPVRGLPVGQNSLWLMSSNGGPAQQLMSVPGKVFFCAALGWTTDSTALIVSKEEPGRSELWIAPINGNAPRRLLQMPMPGLKHLSVHPDGKRIAFQAGESVVEIAAMDRVGSPR